MPRDIDQIINLLKDAMPGVEVEQLQVSNPGADDDGLWFIKLPGKSGEVQIESSNGKCPFLIESNFGKERQHGHTIDEVVAKIRSQFDSSNACE
jgi:hypothetical protein